MLVDWRSSKLRKVAASVGEAETISAFEGVKRAIRLALGAEALLKQVVPVKLHTDSTTVISVAESGITKSMGYMMRTQRVCIGFLKENIGKENICHVPGKDNPADALTKHLPGPAALRGRDLFDLN